MRTRLFVLLVLIAALAAGGYYWYAHVRPGGEAPVADAGAPGGFAMPVEVAKVVAGPLTLSIPTVGSLRSNESVTLSPEIAGRIAELHIEEGGAVAAGATVAVLDQSVDKAELAQAQA